jgi:cardiolipin synthase A/B
VKPPFDVRRDGRPAPVWPAAAGALGALASVVVAARVRARGLEARRGYSVPEDIDVGEEAFLRAVQSMTGATVAHGNTIAPLVNGDEIFPALLGAIRDARETINLLTYIYWSGDIALDVADALADRAEAGLEVNVLLDAVGAAKMSRKLIARMDDAGVRVARFRPLRPYSLTRMNNRTHRKILVADGRVGMTGGVGIADEWTGDAQDPEHWRDTHFRVEGPIVAQLHGAFAENWLEATGHLLAGDRYLPKIEPIAGGVPMQLVRSGSACGATDVEALFFLALRSANSSIELTTAYFSPRAAFVDELVRAVERGVSVKVMTPGAHTDKRIVRSAGRTDYKRLLEGGVQLFEYEPTMLHAKTFVVDGCWSVVGSVNFDARSFELNDEAALCVQDAGFARQLREAFATDLERCREITREAWAHRPVRERVLEGATRAIKGQL